MSITLNVPITFLSQFVRLIMTIQIIIIDCGTN